MTGLTWWIIYLSRIHRISSKSSIMTAPTYPRKLQTALDDTVGSRAEGEVTFEPRGTGVELPPHAIGTVKVRKREPEPVYSGGGLGPDLRSIPWRRRFFWVHADSIFTPGEALLRRARYHELLSVWDYEGKL